MLIDPPADEAELESRLAEPSDRLVADLREIGGDIVLLGAGGKMGPTLAMMARRGLDRAGRSDARVIAVSRWSDSEAARRVEHAGVVVHRADLGPDGDLSELPEAPNVLFLVGAKFGVTSAPHVAWMTNTVLPALVTARYAGSRIVALSTGNVYPLCPVASGGCTEADPPGPVGEYAMSCLGRERVVQAVSAASGTPAVLLRLNYAVELRYGVLADLATTIDAGQPVGLDTGHVNVVWQRYASEVVLRSLRHATSPPTVLNLTGPETVVISRVAEQLGTLLDKPVRYLGTPSETALLSNASACHALFGYPDVPLSTLVDWQVAWLRSGGPRWHKPTKFERRDGRF